MEPRAILHVDMDAFYAAVEQRDRPELAGRPVIVGADPRGGRGRGVVATASYEARRFGVASAMPISEAWRRCPQGAYVRPDMEKYIQVSAAVLEILRRFTDLVEPVSIDEAFLDVTGSQRALGAAPELARRLKQAIRDDTRLTASVGLASSKLVAKVASDMRKPDGLVVVPAGGEAAFLAPLPIRRLWGVGPKMEETLLRLGVHTIGDLSRLEPARLERRLGTHGRDLLLLASGIDDRPVLADRGEAKSLGQETTFDADVGDVTKLRQTLLELADGVARRLRAHSLSGRTVTLKYRDEDFRTLTRAATLERPTDAGDIVFSVAWGLFGKAHGARRVRLLGIYVSGFAGRAQRDMFTEEPAAADRLRDAVARRFGDAALVRATLIPRPGEPPRAALDGAGSRRRRS